MHGEAGHEDGIGEGMPRRVSFPRRALSVTSGHAVVLLRGSVPCTVGSAHP